MTSQQNILGSCLCHIENWQTLYMTLGGIQLPQCKIIYIDYTSPSLKKQFQETQLMEIKYEYIFLTRIVGELMSNGRRYIQICT